MRWLSSCPSAPPVTKARCDRLWDRRLATTQVFVIYDATIDQMGAGCRIGELARRLSVSQAVMSQLADQLEALELVRRVRGPFDRRAVIVDPMAAAQRGWIIGPPQGTLDASRALGG